MKIGILTISKSEASFGANLQCYALWKYVSSLKLGECEVVDLKRPCQFEYKNPRHKFFNEIEKKNPLIKCSLKQKIFAPIHIIRNRPFKKFWELIHFSKTINIDELYKKSPSYDILISGSDQIWNFNMPFYTEVFFLSFNFSGRKISYASSMGALEVTRNHEREIKKYLDSYSSISVREKDAQKYLSDLLGKDVNCNIDPVFLLSKDEWDEICSTEVLIKEKYIFAYSLHYSEQFLKELEFFSEKYNVQVVTYGSKLKLSFIKNVKQAGPREFINLIKNAWYIVTDSFHCVAFSLIYKNNFIAVKNEINKNTISRIETLVSYIKSETYLINQDELHSYSFIPVDYSGYDELLSIVEDSKNYLKEALHE